MTLISAKPPLGTLGLVSLIETSLAVTCFAIALRDFSLSRLRGAPPRDDPPLDTRDVRSRVGVGGGVAVDLPILPLPLTATPMVRSPSRSGRKPLPRPRLDAAGARGAFRGL